MLTLASMTSMRLRWRVQYALLLRATRASGALRCWLRGKFSERKANLRQNSRRRGRRKKMRTMGSMGIGHTDTQTHTAEQTYSGADVQQGRRTAEQTCSGANVRQSRMYSRSGGAQPSSQRSRVRRSRRRVHHERSRVGSMSSSPDAGGDGKPVREAQLTPGATAGPRHVSLPAAALGRRSLLAPLVVALLLATPRAPWPLLPTRRRLRRGRADADRRRAGAQLIALSKGQRRGPGWCLRHV